MPTVSYLAHTCDKTVAQLLGDSYGKYVRQVEVISNTMNLDDTTVACALLLS